MCVHTTGLPGIPMNIRYNYVTSASFFVYWDEVDDANKYLVNWRIGSSSSSSGEVREATILQTSHIITGLTPNTTYYVTVFAINSCGESATGSEIFIVTTNEIEPSSPVTTNEIEPSSPITINKIEPSSTVTANEIEPSSTVMSITTMPTGNLIVHI